MEPSSPMVNECESVVKSTWYTPLTKVTILSKLLAGIILIALPFVGFLVGRALTPISPVTSIVIETVSEHSSSSNEISLVNSKPTFVLGEHGVLGSIDETTYKKESFLSENIVNNDELIALSPECKQYAGGDRCVITIFENQLGLIPGTLKASTSLVSLDMSTLIEARILPEGKLFLNWGFGDAGSRSEMFTVWDTQTSAHTFVSSWYSYWRESVYIETADINTKKRYNVTNSELPVSRPEDNKIDVYDKDVFSSFLELRGEDPSEYCVLAEVTPQNRTSSEASWLVKYTLALKSPVCGEAQYILGYRYYEFSPVDRSMTALTDVVMQPYYLE